MRTPRLPALAAVTALLVATSGCTAARWPSDSSALPAPTSGPPTRFRIVPDDYHVPYAGTAEDGRRFFLSDELGTPETAYVGLFLWHADGTFDEVKVARYDGGKGRDDLVEARLDELGDYDLEPIVVEPFTREVDGETFGWELREYDGDYSLDIMPGDFIAYYAPWDGLDYST